MTRANVLLARLPAAWRTRSSLEIPRLVKAGEMDLTHGFTWGDPGPSGHGGQRRQFGIRVVGTERTTDFIRRLRRAVLRENQQGAPWYLTTWIVYKPRIPKDRAWSSWSF